MSMLPETMTVIEAKRGHGGPDVLVPATRPVPVPGPGEVLIEVEAAGINRPDVLQRQGLYPPPKGASDILGLEVAGKIVARGPGAARFKTAIWSARWSMAAAMPSIAVAPESAPHCPCRQGLSAGRGGGAARDGVHRLAQCVRARRAASQASGCWCMAAASGIGTTAIQMATAFGAKVIATAGSAEKCAPARSSAPCAPSITARRISSKW